MLSESEAHRIPTIQTTCINGGNPAFHSCRRTDAPRNVYGNCLAAWEAQVASGKGQPVPIEPEGLIITSKELITVDEVIARADNIRRNYCTGYVHPLETK